MLDKKDIDELISESEKAEIPSILDEALHHTYTGIRKKAGSKRQRKAAVKSSLATLLVLFLVIYGIMFNIGSAYAKSYVLESGQLYSESTLKKKIPPKISFFNKSKALDIQISQALLQGEGIYIEYTLLGNFANLQSVHDINLERNVKIIGADYIGTEAGKFTKISVDVIVFSETIVIDNVQKDAKAVIVKQQIEKINGIRSDCELTLKIMKQKVKR